MKTGLCGLYRFKNKQGEIIYIGKADDIHKRLKGHKHLEPEQYQEVATIEYAIVNNKADRDIIETMLISQIKPKYNTTQKYTEQASLVIEGEVMLLWQKVNPKEYNFQTKKKEHRGTGVHGRPRIEVPPLFYELYPKWKKGEITATAMAKEVGLTHCTFYRRVKEYEATLNK